MSDQYAYALSQLRNSPPHKWLREQLEAHRTMLEKEHVHDRVARIQGAVAFIRDALRLIEGSDYQL